MFKTLNLSEAPRKTTALLLALTTALGPIALPAFAASKPVRAATALISTATPIQHVVVIFQENVSFDHYFGTYPNALNNNAAEPSFTPAPGTPTVNGLTGALLTNNPNSVNPFRLSRAQSALCDQDHNYTDEQTAFHFGLMDNFLALVPNQFCSNLDVNVPDEIMGYF